MKLRVLYHGNCFDGCASAGLFTRFFSDKIASGPVDVGYTALEHQPGGLVFDDGLFDGDTNACVDFRYSQNPRLDWWIDHHASAFQQPGDEAHFRADRSGKKYYDVAARSCAGLLARTGRDGFGWDVTPYAELLQWAEIIDGAQFADAATPVELQEPALRLMTWNERNRDGELAQRFINDLVSRPLAVIAEDSYVKGPLGPILEEHRRSLDVVRKTARMRGAVVVTDLADTTTQSLNKFVVYYLFPQCRYSVTLLAPDGAPRISVGSNPWAPVPRTHDISRLCERYGGGGHAVVGGIALRGGDLDSARIVVDEVVAALNGPAA